MSEKPQNFEIPNEDGVVIHEDIIPAHITGAEKASDNSEEMNHEVLPLESGEADVNLDESLINVEVAKLDPEDKEAIEVFSQLGEEEQEALAEIAEGTEATLRDAMTLKGKSGHEARVAALGDAFAVTEIAESGEVVVPPINPLRKFTNGSLRVVRHVVTGAIVAIAAFSHTDDAEARGQFTDHLPVLVGIAGAQNSKLGKAIEEGVIRPVERATQGGQRIERILQQQEALEMRHAKLDREKEELLSRASGNSRIADVESRVESRTRPIEMEAKYEVGMAQLKTSRAQLRAAYLSNPSPTAVDQARYEEQIAKLNEREVRLGAQHEINAVKDEVRRDTKNMRAEHGIANVYDQIERKNMEQARIRAQIKKLEMDKVKIKYTTSRDIARDVLRGF